MPLGLTLALLIVVAITQFDLMPSKSPALEPGEAGELGDPRVALEETAAEQTDREPALPASVENEVDEPSALFAFPPRPESTVGSLELHVRWSDGLPAAGVNARVMPWGSDDAFLHQRSVRTDRYGVGVLDQLAPGTVGIYLDRCASWSVDIVAGGVTIHEIQLPAGVTVRGRVLDPQGNPVGSASICLSAHGNPTNGFQVGTADLNGRFELRGVNDQRYLSARAAGFAPSDQFYAKGAKGGVVELELVLRGKTGTITGVVLSPDGRPLIGAKVLITGGVPSGWQEPADGRWRSERPLPFALRTDEEGRFFSDQVGAGSVHVQARAEEWMPWGESVVVTSGETAEVEIRLVAGATLEGIIRHADGSPAARATVHCGRRARTRYGNFERYRGRCGADGRYRVRGLPLGPIELRVAKDDRGKASGKLWLTGDAVNRWDATLVEGLRARGVVVDERGEPLVRWYVGVSDGRGLWYSGNYTDESGRFELTDLKPEWTDLSVAPPDWIETGPSVVLRDVLPAAEELFIEVPDAVLPSASVTLRLLVDGEPAPSDARVAVLSSRPFSQHERHPDATGRVEVTRLLPGEYQLIVNVPERAKRRLDIRVSAEEVLDLGVMNLAVGGRVRLVVDGAGVDDHLHAEAIDPSGAGIEYFDLEGGRGVSGLLLPGDVSLRIGGAGVATQVVEGTVVDGATVELRATLRPGTTRTVLVRSADRTPLSDHRCLLVYNSAGALVQHREGYMSSGTAPSETRSYLGGLELGWYRIVVESPDGQHGEGELTVTTLDPIEGDAAVIVLE